MEEVHRVGILLAEDRYQHIGAGDFLLAGGLHMKDGTLDHALEAQCRLGVDFLGAGHSGCMGGDEVAQRLAQLVDVGGAGAQGLDCGRVVEQRQQQVFDGYEFVPLLAGLNKCHVQTDFEFLGNHVSSMRH